MEKDREGYRRQEEDRGGRRRKEEGREGLRRMLINQLLGFSDPFVLPTPYAKRRTSLATY